MTVLKTATATQSGKEVSLDGLASTAKKAIFVAVAREHARATENVLYWNHSLLHTHGFQLYMAITVVIVFGMYAGAYWVGVSLWPDKAPEPTYNGEPTNELPWTPFNALSDSDFNVFASSFLWLTVCITGLGSEMVLGELFVSKLAAGDDKQAQAAWHAAQLLFSLFVSIAVFAASPLGLPFAVLGLWKFGFPETIGAFRRAWLDGATLAGLKEYANGLAVTLHHTASVWLIVGCTTGILRPRTREILACTLPLVGQHLGVLIKYHSLLLYGIINLILEIWWEWELFAQQHQLTRERGYHASAHGCSLTMLVAHWLYWSAAFLTIPEMVGCIKTPKWCQQEGCGCPQEDDRQLQKVDTLHRLNQTKQEHDADQLSRRSAASPSWSRPSRMSSRE